MIVPVGVFIIIDTYITARRAKTFVSAHVSPRQCNKSYRETVFYKNLRTMKINASLILAAVLLALTASAQNMRYGFTAGFQSCMAHDVGSRAGYKIGPSAQYSFSDNDRTAFLDFSLLLTAKGWSDDIMTAADGNSAEWKLRANYLELPVHIGYALPLNNDVRVIGTVGPYFAVGLWGNSSIGDDSTDDVKVFSDNFYQRFDCGWGLTIGAELHSHLRISAGFEMSVLNPMKNKMDFNPSDRNVSLAVAYLF